MAVINPISIETASLYNPTYSYENYLMPGLATFTLQMLIMLAAVIVIAPNIRIIHLVVWQKWQKEKHTKY